MDNVEKARSVVAESGDREAPDQVESPQNGQARELSIGDLPPEIRLRLVEDQLAFIMNTLSFPVKTGIIDQKIVNKKMADFYLEWKVNQAQKVNNASDGSENHLTDGDDAHIRSNN